jgi:enamine deaminase RidA (YjgF/YER057c/UK114 family)
MTLDAMPEPIDNEQGGYRYLPSLRFAGAGVVSMPGMAIERAVLCAPRSPADGFDLVRRHLEEADRPLSALCGMELRSPAQISMDDFKRFNDVYLSRLDAWGLLRAGAPPLTRTNVAPFANAPQAPSVSAFSYTVPERRPAPSFVVSGVAELPTGARYPQDIVRRGESGPDALVEKARSVVEEIRSVLGALGAAWDDTTSVHLYSRHAIAFELQREVLHGIGVVPVQGIVWHDAAPPVTGLELEVDVRSCVREHVLHPG